MSLSIPSPSTSKPATKQTLKATPERMQHRGEKRAALHRAKLGIVKSTK